MLEHKVEELNKLKLENKIAELKQKQLDEEKAEEEESEKTFELTPVETLTLSNFGLQKENFELKMREIDRQMFAFNRSLFDRLEISPEEYEIGFDDEVPNRVFARKIKPAGDEKGVEKK